MEKMIGTPDTIYYNYFRMLATDKENGIQHCSIESRDPIFIKIHSRPHQLMFADLASLNSMTWINIALGKRGSLFLLNHRQCVNIFSMIVGKHFENQNSNI